MNDDQIRMLKAVIEMIEDGAYGIAHGILTEMVEDPSGEKMRNDWNKLKSLLDLEQEELHEKTAGWCPY